MDSRVWTPRSRDATLVALFALVLYLPTLAFKLVWDDPKLLELVRVRMQAGGLGAVLSSEFLLGSSSLHTGYFRPVVLMSLAGDGWLGGGQTWVFHLTNLLLHAVASGLVVLLLTRLLRDRPAALFGGLLFAAHPVHVEAVAFVSGRTDLWAACFTLLATVLWMRRREEPDGARWAVPLGVSVCLALGALSKELTVMVVAVWLCWDLIGAGGRTGTPASWLRRNWAWLAGALAAIAVVAALRWQALGAVLGGAEQPAPMPGAVDPSAVALLLPRLLVYLKALIVPWPLSAFYSPFDLRPGAAVVLGALLALVLFVLADRKDARHPGAAGLGWTLLFLVPVLGVVSLNMAAAAERFLYIPSFGVCLAAAALWGRLYKRRRRAALAVGGAVLVLFAGGSVVRSRVWRDELTLYTNMAKTSPRAFVAHFNLGNELAKVGRLEAADASLAHAVELAPGRADGWNNLGSVRTLLGRDADAENAFAEAVRLQPEFVVAIRNRAMALVRLGQPEQALVAMYAISSPGPDDAPPLLEAGTALADAGRFAEAEAAFRRAIRAAPELGKAYSYLGFLYLNQNKLGDALPLLERAVALDPTDAAARANLAVARKGARGE
jgi:Flp pilus assembly protein TadD